MILILLVSVPVSWLKRASTRQVWINLENLLLLTSLIYIHKFNFYSQEAIQLSTHNKSHKKQNACAKK